MVRVLASPTWDPRHTCTRDTVHLLDLLARGFLLTATATPATRDRDQAMAAPHLMEDPMEVTGLDLAAQASTLAILHHRASILQLRDGTVPAVPLGKEVLLLQVRPAVLQ